MCLLQATSLAKTTFQGYSVQRVLPWTGSQSPDACHFVVLVPPWKCEWFVGMRIGQHENVYLHLIRVNIFFNRGVWSHGLIGKCTKNRSNYGLYRDLMPLGTPMFKTQCTFL